MADLLGTMQQFLPSWAGGTPAAPPPPVEKPTIVKEFPAAQPAQYPTNEDAEFAKKQDFAYGSPAAPYANNQSYTLLTGDWNAKPYETKTVEGDALKKMQSMPPYVQKALDNFYARALLAVQNSGLATLGFDPSKTALDIMRDPTRVNILGDYRAKTDEMYANALSESTIVHESLHRGIQKLKGTPYWKPEFDEIFRKDNESTVRHIMQTKMGNPEAAETGKKGADQRAYAEWLFSKSPHAQRLTKLLADMEQAASQYMADKRPGGPR